ncbi:hypothetical protein BT69DRAFT_1344120 [Atractiella rhizophila]|nr:hypothetical protein BT69DRAFT_1344120 [Atractiella rhizophila]
MTFKNQEFDFLDSLVNHLGYLLGSPQANPSTRSVDLEVKKGVETLKGQMADPKDVKHALSQVVNPATLGAKMAESMASHLSRLHGGPNAKHFPSLSPRSAPHPPIPPNRNLTNNSLQLSLTWKGPETLQADSPIDELLEEGAIPECTLIKEESQKLVMIFNDLFMAKCIPSEVYQKTPGAERAASKMSPLLKIQAAQRLKSRDLRLHLYHPSEVQLAIDTQEVWLPHLESGWPIKPKSFPIIVHAVPTSFNINSKEEVRRRIEPFNLNLCEHITKISWCRTKKMSTTPSEKVKTHSSLIIALDSPQ